MPSTSQLTSNSRSMNGLNTLSANSVFTDSLEVGTLQIDTQGTAPTRPFGDSTTNIANTQFVQSAVSGISGTYVDLTTNQTITSGTKIFNVLPQSSVIPLNPNDLVNKNYADSGAFVNLTTAQSIGGAKNFTSNIIAGAGIIPVSGNNLTLTTTGGEDVIINGSNDITFNSAFNTVFNAGAYGSFQAGVGYTFVNNGGYGFVFNDNGSAGGGGLQLTSYSNNIVNTSVNNINYNSASIFGTYYNGPNRGVIYDNTVSNLPSTTGITFTNGGDEDAGVVGTAMTVSIPAGNIQEIIRVSIPFDLFTYNYTNPSLSGAGNFSLSYTELLYFKI